MRKVLFLTCAIALSACQSPVAIESDPVAAGVKSTVQKNRLANGTSKVAIRSYKTVGGKSVEFAGASCVIESDEVYAKVVTPAQIIVPKFVQNKAFQNRGVPTSLVAVCTADGKTAASQGLVAQKQIHTVGGAGIAGILVTTVASAAIATSTPWAYQGGIKVVFDE